MITIALASPPIPRSLSEGLSILGQLVNDAATQQADIICFPESYLPGYPGMPYPQEDRSAERLENALQEVSRIAAINRIAIIIPMDWHLPEGLFNLAHVISSTGEVLGYQTKNQLDPSEDLIWKAGTKRRIFEVKGVRFGITICHEGFRYPESVRWAAQQGAQIVFHPHFAGSNTSGVLPSHFGSMDNPYYERAMMMRALENTVYFASSNYATAYPESASAIIAPDGRCLVHAAYGRPGIILTTIDPEIATGLLARRFKNHLYQ